MCEITHPSYNIDSPTNGNDIDFQTKPYEDVKTPSSNNENKDVNFIMPK